MRSSPGAWRTARRTRPTPGDRSRETPSPCSTAYAAATDVSHVRSLRMVPNDSMDPLFAATVQATEEAVVNAMVAAEDMTGIDGHHVRALPHEQLRAVLARYNRLAH